MIAVPGAEALQVKCETPKSFSEKISLNLNFKFKNQDGFQFKYTSKIPLSLMNYTSSFFTDNKTKRFDNKPHLDPRFQDINIDYSKILLNSTKQIDVKMVTK